MEMNMTNLLWFFAFIFLAGGNGFGVDQTQTILNNLGRFVAWAGSGSQSATGA